MDDMTYNNARNDLSTIDNSVENKRIRGAIEAILIVSDKPIMATQIAPIVRASDLITDDDTSVDSGANSEDSLVNIIEATLLQLAEQYKNDERGFELYHGVQGWQLVSSQEYEHIVAQFIVDGHTSRLSQAALETLAIIAYKQPITRGSVSAIRGVNSDGVIRSLTVRGLIREHGEEETTHASLLITTGLFLDKMGISSLDQLPQLAPFLPDSLPVEDE